MNTIGVIPARWGASRFEGKVLAEVAGKPIIQHVWEGARRAKLLDDLIVATDDERVVKAVERFGGKVCFTSPKQPSGTDRITEVVNPLDVKIVVNIQGDEPLIKGIIIDNLISALQDDPKVEMATVVRKITTKQEVLDPNVVKVVLDKKGYALYFSRSPIPYVRDAGKSGVDQGKLHLGFYKHIGIYAYTKDFLFTYTNLPFSKLESAEKLEQLRALEYGYRIKTVETDQDTIGIDTPEDLERLKKTIGGKL
ncbi:MAG: 3-deoxy-manno-octulosonate cytidylyltransferase [Candidatus Omnitrophica bacterium]|nr:3-deoxy-manno-octulosonate cytidylyltransferase [Candidatus Omnitrophota bacterium]